MEDLEQIMRRIHVLFAKCEPYGEEGGEKIIVPKKELFRLLEKLNYAVIRMMDLYEGTQESRARGLSTYQRESEKIRESAKAGAEDVYAASLIYTDNMIEELSDVLEDAKEELWEQYARMAGRLDEQARMLVQNQEEIKQQLNAMAQGEKYLNLIERENMRLKRVEAARAVDTDEDEEDDFGEYEEDVPEMGGEISDMEPGEGNEPGTDSQTPRENAAEALADGDVGGESLKTSLSKKESKNQHIQKNKHGKRRKSAANHARMDAQIEAEWEKERTERTVRKVGTALYEEVGQEYDAPTKKVTYEVKVNQAYFDQLGEGNVDLDAEYYQWKEEQAQAAATKEQSGESEVLQDNVGKTEEKVQESGQKDKKSRLRFGKRRK